MPWNIETASHIFILFKLQNLSVMKTSEKASSDCYKVLTEEICEILTRLFLDKLV